MRCGNCLTHLPSRRLVYMCTNTWRTRSFDNEGGARTFDRINARCGPRKNPGAKKGDVDDKRHFPLYMIVFSSNTQQNSRLCHRKHVPPGGLRVCCPNILSSTATQRAGEDRLIGGDTGLAAVMARARMVSRSNAPVLLFGETGTGKEIVARAIHEHSAFRNGPFRRVNCGAIAPELIDSELFGHEQGAFTGALTRRKGWFEQADGGTLFLDEVGELALAAQVRLLRVVQDGEVIRVGGERPVLVKVRIVAATHRDLPAMVEAQTFREDLYYRLSVFPIVIPPLRDRPSDIRAFAEYFAERAAQPVRLATRACVRRRCPRARRVSMAGKCARDGSRDGPGRPDRTGTGAQLWRPLSARVR